MVVGAVYGADEIERFVIGTDALDLTLTPDSLFPVASITKLATALAALRLVDDGTLGLDVPLAHYLPDAAAARPGVTLRRLLSHSAGLPDEIISGSAPYEAELTWPRLARACLATPPVRPPSTRVAYSNVGYGLIAIMVEQQTKMDFPSALRSLVLDPLGIEGYLGSEPTRPPVTLADVRSEHTATPLEPFNSPFWRSLGLPWGGLLTTMDGALALIRAFSGIPKTFLTPTLASEALQNQTGDLSGGYGGIFNYPHCPWGLGPDLRDSKDPHWAPVESSPETYGHAGASGCVVWFDPSADVGWVVLGARTADNGWLLRGTPSIGKAILETLA